MLVSTTDTRQDSTDDAFDSNRDDVLILDRILVLLSILLGYITILLLERYVFVLTAVILKLRALEGGKSRLMSIILMYDFLGEIVLYFIETVTNKDNSNITKRIIWVMGDNNYLACSTMF